MLKYALQKKKHMTEKGAGEAGSLIKETPSQFPQEYIEFIGSHQVGYFHVRQKNSCESLQD